MRLHTDSWNSTHSLYGVWNPEKQQEEQGCFFSMQVRVDPRLSKTAVTRSRNVS